ncbi:MAG: sigma-70 family RNA polymerase sigma factor [Bacteroidia bacterium]
MPFENKGEICDPKQWVSRYADYLYKYAIARLNDEEIAKDLVQETFFSALKGLDKFAGKSTEKTWLTGILKHKIIDIYRKDYARSNAKSTQFVAEEEYFNKDDGHWRAQHAPQTFGVEQQDPLTNKEFHQTLQLCFKKLPALWATVFTMKHVDEEPTETILLSMNISSSNFWVIIHRTKLSLRACLQSNWL